MIQATLFTLPQLIIGFFSLTVTSCIHPNYLRHLILLLFWFALILNC
jgi:hypothetical protein